MSGEYDEDYADVANQPKIAKFPESDPMRWTVLLDAVLIGDSGSASLSSTVSGAPSGKAVVMLDSGTSYTFVKRFITDEPYIDLLASRLVTLRRRCATRSMGRSRVLHTIRHLANGSSPAMLKSTSLSSSGTCAESWNPAGVAHLPASCAARPCTLFIHST